MKYFMQGVFSLPQKFTLLLTRKHPCPSQAQGGLLPLVAMKKKKYDKKKKRRKQQ
jgi:hypothetical protein